MLSELVRHQKEKFGDYIMKAEQGTDESRYTLEKGIFIYSSRTIS